ncbi:MAG: hypothetical protein JSV33_13545 [bacterium]|nr:MAG: hypothetical protein JSV33_13545 [bacterium]
MKRTRISLDDLCATFSSYIEEHYPTPKAFQKNLDMLLGDKRNRITPDEYMSAIEKNVVFLNDLIIEGEALLDLLVKKYDLKDADELNTLLQEMESRARGHTEERYRRIFIEGKDAKYESLRKLKRTDVKSYIGKLEFDYRYLMTFRIMLFEFFNILVSLREKYRITFGRKGAVKRIVDQIELTANYYLGNVKVEEGGNIEVEDGGKDEDTESDAGAGTGGDSRSD